MTCSTRLSKLLTFYSVLFFSINAIAVIDSNIGKKNVQKSVAGRLLIEFKSDLTTENISSLSFDGLQVKATENILSIDNLKLVSFDENISLQDAKEKFRKNPNVKNVYEDILFYPQVTPNDDYWNDLWGLENIGQSGGTADADINASSMWDIEQGDTNVVIGVIDTGIDPTHPDLIENMWVNTREIPNNNIDDDQNGYIDDIHGINAINNSGKLIDDNRHGTHVAGTIAARGNNNKGVIGVAPNIKVAGCKFISAADGGALSDALKCMDYFLNLKLRSDDPVNIVATNNSWGGGGPSDLMKRAIEKHKTAEILFVAAAGNDNADNDTGSFYPANYAVENVISVGASDRNDRKASFSNYGKKSVHVFAPGHQIYSTTPNNGYQSLSGTSMASPHVAGLIGIIASAFPEFSMSEIKNLVLTSGELKNSFSQISITGRRIRGFGEDGTGALTCQNQTLAKRNFPSENRVYVKKDTSIFLSALSINCEKSGGDITVYNSDTLTITLKDDGQNGDANANDGIASFAWSPAATGEYILDFGRGDLLTVVVNDDGGDDGNPGAGKYRIEKKEYFYENINGTRLNASDDSMHTIKIPFTIPFNKDGRYDYLYISANGTISFTDQKDPGYRNKRLPMENFATIVAPFYDDLTYTDANADIYADVLGESPNRRLVVEWWKVTHYGATGLGAFQVVFYENTPDFEVNYLDVVFGKTAYNNGKSATIGLQTSSENYVMHSFNQAAIESQSSYVYKFE